MSELTYVELHGDRIAYRDVGRGPALLLIHGMAGSSATWQAIIPQLSKKYRVIAPDLLGHGESAKPRGDYSLGAFAVWLRDLLDELGVRRATVIGQSLGGGIAMQFAYQHRDYCERLVLIGQWRSGPRPQSAAAGPVGARCRVRASGSRTATGTEPRQQVAFVADLGRDPGPARRSDVAVVLLPVGSSGPPGVLADLALGGGPPRSGRQCAE